MGNRIRELFLAAADLPGDERSAFLAAECGDDTELQAAVEELLLLDETNSELLDVPAAEGHRDWFEQAPAEDEGATSILPQAIGSYPVLRILGEGGMGIVYLAERPPPLGGRVALKVLKIGMNTRDVLGRFEVERRAMALMNHSGIAKVFDSGTTETGQPYFAMEWIDGESITTFCDRRSLGIRERLEIFLRVCDAVQHAHQKAIIHRDLKPSNILVTLESDLATPKIIDFGIAKATGDAALAQTLFTADGRFVGTPEYMSPEQASAERREIDTRTDIYSLGIVLYELLVGYLPFRADRSQSVAGLSELLESIREIDPPRLTTRLRSVVPEELDRVVSARGTSAVTFLRELRGDLEWIVAKALEKHPDRRYASASEFAGDIRRYLTGDTVSVTPPTAFYRLSKLVGRYRRTVFSVLLLMLGLSVSLAVTLFAYWEAESARQRSERLVEERDRTLIERNRALAGEHQARTRSESLRLLAEARSIANDQPELALLLALHAARSQRGAQVNESLLAVLQSFVPYQEIPYDGRVHTAAFHPEGTSVATSVFGPQPTRLWDAANAQLLREFPGYTMRATFSPDGRRIATYSDEAGVRVWDVDSGELVRQFKKQPAMLQLLFDPAGLRLLGTGRANIGSIWELESGRRVALRGHTQRTILGAAWSPDGKRVATACRDGHARLFDSSSGELLQDWSLGGEVGAIEFSPNGERLAAIAHGGRLTEWDPQSGAELSSIRIAGGQLLSLAYSPLGTHIAVGSTGRFAAVLRVGDGREKRLLGHRDIVETVAFSRDGEQLVTASRDKTLRTWRAPDWAPASILRGHRDQIMDTRFAPTDDRIVSASFDSTVRIWQPKSALDQLTIAHESRVYSAAFSPSGDLVVTASRDRSARVFDVRSRSVVHRLQHPSRVYRVRCDVTSRYCVATTSDSGCYVWDLERGEPMAVFRGHSRLVMGLAIDPEGQRVATGSEDRSVQVWRLHDAGQELTLRHGSRVDCVEFNSDGNRLATGTTAGRVALWDARSGEAIGSAQEQGRVHDLTFVSDSDRIMVACDGGVVMLDLDSGDRVELQGHTGKVRRIETTADGSHAISASDDESICVWDLENGTRLRVLSGHEQSVSALSISPDEELVASGSEDGTVRLWRLSDGASFGVLRRHSDRVTSVEFSPDGQWIVSTAEDGLAIVWPRDFVRFAETLQSRELTVEERERFEVPPAHSGRSGE